MRQLTLMCQFNDVPGSPREQMVALIEVDGAPVATWRGQWGGDGYFVRRTIYPAGLYWAHCLVNLPIDQWYNDASEGVMLAQTHAGLAYAQMVVQQRISERPVEQRRQSPEVQRLLGDAMRAVEVYGEDALERFAAEQRRTSGE